MHFLNRILQAESSILVNLSHRALRHCCLLSIAIYGGSLSLHRTDSHLPVPILGSILFQSKCLPTAATVVKLFRAFRPTSARYLQCWLLCSIRLDSATQLQLSVDLSGSSAVYRQNLQTLLSVSSTLHFPVAPRVLLRASHRHRIASQRGLSFLLNRTECFLDDQIRKSQRRVLHC